MIFGIIDPKSRTVRGFEAQDYKPAVEEAGLRVGELDFGTIASWPDGSTLSIIVYEWGLMKGDPKGYFGFNRGLYNGPAVIFRANPEGETVSLSPNLVSHLNSGCKALLWLGNSKNVEMAINSGLIHRPQTSINGHVTWEWRP